METTYLFKNSLLISFKMLNTVSAFLYFILLYNFLKEIIRVAGKKTYYKRFHNSIFIFI